MYIRTRDSIKTTGGIYNCVCCTCNRTYPRLGKGSVQAGHFIPGRRGAVLFSEKGVHAQCQACNLNPPHGKGGNIIEYWPFMERTYGREFVEQLISESKKTVKYTVPEYRGLEQYYTAKTEKLLADGAEA